MTEFLWSPHNPAEKISISGMFTLDDVAPFISHLSEPHSYLFMRLEGFSLDFFTGDDASIEMEIMDTFEAGDHFATVGVAEAEQITRLAFEHRNSETFRDKLTDLRLQWLI